MDENEGTTSSASATEENRLEGMLQGLWERVRQAGELVTELRSQKSILMAQVGVLQREIAQLRKECSAQQDVVKSLSEQLTAAGSVEGKILSNGEKEKIAARVKELLARIEGYL